MDTATNDPEGRCSMADGYVDAKVREALIAARGSRAMAQKTLMTWAMDDHRLLQGMATPFLKAIAGAAVERAWRRGVRGTGAPAPVQRGLTKEALQSVISRIGQAPGDPAEPPEPANPDTADNLGIRDIFGSGGGVDQGGRQQASAVKTLANAFLQKKLQR